MGLDATGQMRYERTCAISVSARLVKFCMRGLTKRYPACYFPRKRGGTRGAGAEAIKGGGTACLFRLRRRVFLPDV